MRGAVLTCDRMDEHWFKSQKRKAGVTNADIGALRGRDHTVITKLVSGRQPFTMDWAEVFAEALKVPLATVLEKAGVTDPATAQTLVPGFAESDAVLWQPKTFEDRKPQAIAEAFGARPGVDVWQIKGTSMVGAGLLPGDYALVDANAADNAKPGDTVVVQVYSRNGTAKTVLRRWIPPVALSFGAAGDATEAHVVDHENVMIRGKVVASWRL